MARQAIWVALASRRTMRSKPGEIAGPSWSRSARSRLRRHLRETPSNGKLGHHVGMAQRQFSRIGISRPANSRHDRAAEPAVLSVHRFRTYSEPTCRAPSPSHRSRRWIGARCSSGPPFQEISCGSPPLDGIESRSDRHLLARFRATTLAVAVLVGVLIILVREFGSRVG